MSSDWHHYVSNKYFCFASLINFTIKICDLSFYMPDIKKLKTKSNCILFLK